MHRGREIYFLIAKTRQSMRSALQTARYVLMTPVEKYGSIGMAIVWWGRRIVRVRGGTPSKYTVIIIIIDGRAKDVLKPGKHQRAPPCHNKVDEWRSSVVWQPTSSQAGTGRTAWRQGFDVRRSGTAETHDPRRRPPSTKMKSGLRRECMRRLVDANQRNMRRCGEKHLTLNVMHGCLSNYHGDDRYVSSEIGTDMSCTHRTAIIRASSGACTKLCLAVPCHF